LQVCAGFSAPRGSGKDKWIVERCAAVVVQAQDYPGEMGIIRLRPAKLVIQLVARRPRSIGEILHLPPPAIVPHVDIKLPIRPEAENAAIMITSQRLVHVRLEGSQSNEIVVERERGSIPDEAIDAITQQGHFFEGRRVCARRAFGPKKINARICGKGWVKRNPEQTSLRCGIDGQIERRERLNDPVHYAFHMATGLLENQQVIITQECHGRRSEQSAHDRSDTEFRVHQSRLRRHPLDREKGCRNESSY
jgi:hypothetical protein